jgi:hypothetical protein
LGCCSRGKRLLDVALQSVISIKQVAEVSLQENKGSVLMPINHLQRSAGI